jgi:small subunit ribosomal protein S4
MGSPIKLRKKYSVPRTLWDSDRIKEEGGLLAEYGLKNTKELWIVKEKMRKIRNQARSILGLGEKGQKELEDIANRITNLGYTKSRSIEDLLGLEIRAILERRLQTIVLRKGLARSMKQARQLITHGFIAIDGKKVSTPGYLVPVDLEDKISYYKSITLYTPESAAEKRIKKAAEAISESPAETESDEAESNDEEIKKAEAS